MNYRLNQRSEVSDQVVFISDIVPEEQSWLKKRLTGPGALYNAGNLLALSAGIVLNLRDVWGQTGFAVALKNHLIGSPEAAWLTAAMILFIFAGEIYHQAYQSNARSYLLSWADFVAGLAAIALTVALVKLGDTAAALVAGFMLTLGKIGSAALPIAASKNASLLDRKLRLLVVASRAPSILALCVTVAPALLGNVPLNAVLLPFVMIVCFLLWLWADLLLLKRS